jgi:hypothetical protein
VILTADPASTDRPPTGSWAMTRPAFTSPAGTASGETWTWRPWARSVSVASFSV